MWIIHMRRFCSASRVSLRYQYWDVSVGSKFSGRRSHGDGLEERVFGRARVVEPVLMRNRAGGDMVKWMDTELYGSMDGFAQWWARGMATTTGTALRAQRGRKLGGVGISHLCKTAKVLGVVAKFAKSTKRKSEMMHKLREECSPGGGTFWERWQEQWQREEESGRVKAQDLIVIGNAMYEMRPPRERELWDQWIRAVVRLEVSHVHVDYRLKLLEVAALKGASAKLFSDETLLEKIVASMHEVVKGMRVNQIERLCSALFRLPIPIDEDLSTNILVQLERELMYPSRKQVGFLTNLFLHLPNLPSEGLLRRWEDHLLGNLPHVSDYAATFALKAKARSQQCQECGEVPDYFLTRWTQEMTARSPRLTGHLLVSSLKSLADLRIRPPQLFLSTWGPAMTIVLPSLNLKQLQCISHALVTLKITPTPTFEHQLQTLLTRATADNRVEALVK
uniref:Uncharacterized protein n=1 Tax=Compsopogon caeruleus TaxID=31354 RepID=A0A6T6CHS1_9RHOD|mmetsp:Transcript_610/g.1209  ORF Transcript_610/g.1209 Transcript_610/m.1209 type:complete len:450 (+) Transcript_610:84-1433(+)|eukprot:CAMPEP_0184680560 /NCGR_PEP_ID=MMETSP0312-20130426/3436_1 /TAXON_ID=31354 /ORGANISM="Compsopogon coeruleus, Strain SAG 36.94" /LENGTH=449 /DNA_ID=CAMNT_0027130747 /DNA_START=78 /DNA_END=1427 /DNA_ORIENTATION=+